MSLCSLVTDFFDKYITEIDQSAAVELQKDKPLRYNIWKTTPQIIKDLFEKGTEALPDRKESQRILLKLEGMLRRINESNASAEEFINDIIDNENNIEMSIALFEVMESIKGEADKARNLDIEVTKISEDGILPAIPMSRVAASVGRKIIYQKGYRYTSQAANASPAEIEMLYYQAGREAIELLQGKGYLDINEGLATIQDYINIGDLKKSNPKTNFLSNEYLSISLNTDKMGIEANSLEADYFLNRSNTDLTDTELGVISDMLRAIRQITQPSHIVLPDTKIKMNAKQLAELDDPNIGIDPTTAEVRKNLYDTPVYVHSTIHELLKILNTEALKTGKTGTQIIQEDFSGFQDLIKSLFGLKLSEDFSVDKSESITGQNLSKTTPLDDLVEYYDLLMENGSPAGLHMPMKIGRNARLYYHNSVLNAHGSKQSRYMLTAGQYTVDSGSADANYLVYGISEALSKGKISFQSIIGTEQDNALESALEALSEYKGSNDLGTKLTAMSDMATAFPGVDYVTLITALQAVQDVRSPTKGKITTEFMVSADATASGGTLTFLQALGTSPEVQSFLEDIGLLKNADGTVEIKLNDLYGVMSDTINKFIKGEKIPLLKGQDRGAEKGPVRQLMSDTLDLLFDNGKNVRELSKDPTMTFVYGQGRAGAIDSMSRSLADRIIDNLEDPNIQKYLVKLTGNNKYKKAHGGDLKDIKGLYKEITTALRDTGLTEQLYNLMDASINKKYLKDYKDRSTAVFDLVKKVDAKKFKILPAGAVLAGRKTTLKDLKKYGMPLSKIFETVNQVPDTEHTVLTRSQKLTKTVADVSPVHGMDAAQLYHSLLSVQGDQGVVVIHDDVRGTVQDIRAMENKYKETTVDVTQQYDLHHQIMQAIAAYGPDVASTPEYQQLMAEIEASMQEKSRIMDENFNKETSALIGDGNKFQEFAKDTSQESSQKNKNQKKNNGSETIVGIGPNVVMDPETRRILEKLEKGENLTRDEIEGMYLENKFIAAIKRLAEDSPIIDNFLKSQNRAALIRGMFENGFVPNKDLILITGDDQGIFSGDPLEPIIFDMNNTEHRKMMTQIVEHEITHANTVGYLHKYSQKEHSNTAAAKDIRYFERTIEELTRLRIQASQELSAHALNRLTYILSQNTPIQAVSELVAVLNAETETANEIYQFLKNHHKYSSKEVSLRQRIKKFIERMFKGIFGGTEEDLSSYIDADRLMNAVITTMAKGTSQREHYFKENEIYLASYQNTYGFNNATEAVRGQFNYLNHAVASILTAPLERKGKRLAGNIHSILKTLFPMYTDAANMMVGIYNENEHLQQFMHTLTGEGVDKERKANLLSSFSMLMSQQKGIINTQMGKFNKELKVLTEAEKEKLGEFITKAPLHDFFNLTSGIETAEAVAEAVDDLEAKFRKDHSQVLKEINELIAWNIHGEGNGKILSLDSSEFIQKGGTFADNAKILMALKSIQEIGGKDFERMLKHIDLMNLVRDTVMANSISLLANKGSSLLSDSLIPDFYKNNIVPQAFSLKELKYYEGKENLGWHIIKAPTANELGIAYKEIVDQTDIVGAYTDIRLKSKGISVPDNFAKYKNVVKAGEGYVLRLTDDQRADMGITEDWTQSLVRGMAHSMAIQQSQVIRDELIKKETRIEINDAKAEELVTQIEANNIDHSWFVKLGENINYQDLPDIVKAKYMKISKTGKRASNVHGFEGKVDLVRKDIAHWLMGGNSSSLFQNTRMQWALRILKDLIAGAKIGMVVMNPYKIAQDNISNIAYLGVRGVDPLFMTKNYHDIAASFQEYSELERKILNLKIQLVANPKSEAIKKKIKTLRDRVAQNSVGDIGEKGFVNSLGSDLVAKNADTLSGLQADMHTALEYLLLDNKGHKRYVSHFIVKLQDLGFKGEDFLTYIGNIAASTSTRSGEGMKTELDQVVERLKEIRTDEDVINYVSQYTNSPGSEAVRIGASATDLTDVMAKETLYRHLVQNEGMNEKDARLEVLDSFPDYKENMPIAIKQLSDVGIIMFPSFWLRIQKVIYRMVRDKPVNLATELMLEDALGSNVNTIMDANIINKHNTFGGLLHSPLETPGLGSVFPTHLFN